MTTITIEKPTNLKSHYQDQRELVEDILENLGYVTLWEMEAKDLPSEVKEAYKKYKKNPPKPEEWLDI